MKRKGALGKLLRHMSGPGLGWTNSLNRKIEETKERTEEERLKTRLQNQKNRKQGQKHETGLGRATGLTQVPGSGSGMYKLGDLANDDWHLEAKSTRSGVIRFDQKWVDKASRQARRLDRNHIAIAIQFVNRMDDHRGELEAVAVRSLPDPDMVRLDPIVSTTRTIGIAQKALAGLAPGKTIPLVLPEYPHLYLLTISDFAKLIDVCST